MRALDLPAGLGRDKRVAKGGFGSLRREPLQADAPAVAAHDRGGKALRLPRGAAAVASSFK